MAEITGLGNIRSADQTISDDLVVTDALTVNGNATLGNAGTDTLGFYGATAVNQPSSSDQAVYTVTAVTDLTSDNTTVHIARTNQVLADLAGLSTLLHEVRGQLVSLGLIAGS